ncbi:MAG: Abi family protein [Bacteroidales bacterium]|nr:Abi family protein [Candidatus Cacconaster scatequi]
MGNQMPRSIVEQINRLKCKGMHFDDENMAHDSLSHISYFRLKYYWKDMLDPETEEDFLSTASFEDVLKRYDFDRQLRVILFSAIEIIEVALRTKIINHLSQAANSGLWYLDRNLFERQDYFEDFVYDLKYEFNRCTEPFAKKYIEENPDWDYGSFDGPNPDAWMIFEGATFGTLSKMYKNLKNQMPARSKIANDFGLYSANEFSSWLEAISVTRNIIAHHSRLWNRTLSKQTMNLKSHRDKWLNTPLTEGQKKKPYGIITAMLYLCNAVCPQNNIREQLLHLLDNNQDVPYSRLGFSGTWRNEPIWK